MGEYEVAMENGQPKNPTCELEGEERSYCQRVFANGPCGYYESRKIDPLGHVFAETYTVDLEPTCIADGLESKHCTREGCTATTDARAIAAKGHQFSEWTTTKNANCGTDGQKERTCSVCGYKETETISKYGNHTWGEWKETTAPRCNAEGVSTRKCSICGATETKPIATTDHSYGALQNLRKYELPGYHGYVCVYCGNIRDDKEACDKNGSYGEWIDGVTYDSEISWAINPETTHYVHCSKCGAAHGQNHESVDSVEATYACLGDTYCLPSKKCKCGRILWTGSPVGHEYTEKITKYATCTEDGTKVKNCKHKGCGYSTNVTIKATGHPSTHSAIGSVCGSSGHIYETICNVCGATTSSVLVSHSMGDWKTTTSPGCCTTGLKEKKCACGYSESATIAATGNHPSTYKTYVNTGSSHIENTVCVASGKTVSSTSSSHSMGSWTTTTSASCSKEGSKTRKCACGYSETQSIAKTSHPSTHGAVGSNCGSSGHIYKTVCNVCGTTISSTQVSHSFGSWSTTSSATCSSTGSKQRSCSCGYYETSTIAKTSHSYSWVTTKSATCTSKGTQTYKCSKCGATNGTKSIPALGHYRPYSGSKCLRCGAK